MPSIAASLSRLSETAPLESSRGQAAQVKRERAIRARISQRLGEHGPDWALMDVDPNTLPEAVRRPDVPLSDAERDEDEDLERDVLDLHRLHSLHDVSLRRGRRAAAPFVARTRAVVVRALAPVLERQSTFNGAVTRAVSHLRNRTLRHEEILREGIGNLTPAIRRHAKWLHEVERRVRVLERERMQSGPARLDELAFANRFRGEPADVMERQRPYVALFEGATDPVLDFGCGRGEFLELLGNAGIDARGVDSDPSMVALCRSKGLDVTLRDGLSYLGAHPPESLGGVFVAQVVEHLELPQLLTLLRLSRQTLRSGARLLVETHNPQTFATYPLFAIDPTHVRLYHHETLVWLMEQGGFVDVEVKFPDPVPEDRLEEIDERLASFLHGHLTYAVFGQAPAT